MNIQSVTKLHRLNGLTTKTNDMKTAKEFLFSKYPLVSPEWFNDNELTQEMIKMMESYAFERLRDELLSFLKWMEWTGQYEFLVDDYLKTENRTELKSKQ